MIYVDVSGHMITDGEEEELHLFAEQLGLKRSWYQNLRHPHYDLITRRPYKPNTRLITKAISLGAIMVSSKEIVRISKKKALQNPKDGL